VGDPAGSHDAALGSVSPCLWIERLTLTQFRNYERLTLAAGPRPVVLTGANGAGKTNLIEAVSLLAAGQGLRRAPFADLVRASAGPSTTWAIASRLHTMHGVRDIGTGLAPNAADAERAGRIVRIDGETHKGSGVLAEHVEMVWLTPAMDGLFTGAAGERRRFLDRLILTFDPGYRARLGHFERAMASRNRLLTDDVRDPARFSGLEHVLAETGVAIAAARAELVAALAGVIAARRSRAPDSPFPWALLALEGPIEESLASQPAVEIEEAYRRRLAANRERDRAAGRMLDGPHRSDFIVGHGPKDMPARLSSTGEQKALLVGLILAHAELICRRNGGSAPILLLDEIAAHLDPERRAALFGEILELGTQAWMTGTDHEAFSALVGRADILRVSSGRITPIDA
jgi:DNA replication and repair protein RecF